MRHVNRLDNPKNCRPFVGLTAASQCLTGHRQRNAVNNTRISYAVASRHGVQTIYMEKPAEYGGAFHRSSRSHLWRRGFLYPPVSIVWFFV